jgi:hypothetical protein
MANPPFGTANQDEDRTADQAACWRALHICYLLVCTYVLLVFVYCLYITNLLCPTQYILFNLLYVQTNLSWFKRLLIVNNPYLTW